MTSEADRRPGFWVHGFPVERRAVSALFMVHGFVVGNWVPKIPEFAKRLDLSEGDVGLMILCIGIGSVLILPVIGALIAWRGSRVAVRIAATVVAFLILVITLAPTIPFAVAAMLLGGAAFGAMEIAINANAVSVERSMRHSIMSSCHGFWSLGAFAGAGFGGLAIAHVGIVGHALTVTAVAVLVLAYTWPRVLEDGMRGDAPRQRLRLPMTMLPYVIGFIVMISMIPERAVLDWSALYLTQDLGGGTSTSGLGFGALAVAMAVTRFAGDPLRDRFGAVTTLRLCALCALAGFVIAGLAPTEVIAIAGFTIAGIGLANMVPIAYSAAGNQPGLAPGIGLAVGSFMGNAGVFLAPPAIGFIAEQAGFATIFIGLSVLFVVMAALSRVTRYADAGSE